MKTGAYLIISDARRYIVIDEDLRAILVQLIAAERADTRAYLEKKSGEPHFSDVRHHLISISKARIGGYIEAIGFVQTARELKRAMRKSRRDRSLANEILRR